MITGKVEKADVKVTLTMSGKDLQILTLLVGKTTYHDLTKYVKKGKEVTSNELNGIYGDLRDLSDKNDIEYLG